MGGEEVSSNLLPNLGKSLSEKIVCKPTPEKYMSNRDEVQTQEGGIQSTTLPDHLVERILAMMPFPYVFKARVLSKSWRARFSSISCQEDEEKECLAMSFQQEMGKWSDNWNLASCPPLINEEDLIAYEQLAIVCGQLFDPELGILSL